MGLMFHPSKVTDLDNFITVLSDKSKVKGVVKLSYPNGQSSFLMIRTEEFRASWNYGKEKIVFPYLNEGAWFSAGGSLTDMGTFLSTPSRIPNQPLSTEGDYLLERSYEMFGWPRDEHYTMSNSLRKNASLGILADIKHLASRLTSKVGSPYKSPKILFEVLDDRAISELGKSLGHRSVQKRHEL